MFPFTQSQRWESRASGCNGDDELLQATSPTRTNHDAFEALLCFTCPLLHASVDWRPFSAKDRIAQSVANRVVERWAKARNAERARDALDDIEDCFSHTANMLARVNVCFE